MSVGKPRLCEDFSETMDEKNSNITKPYSWSDQAKRYSDQPALSAEYLRTVARDSGLIGICEACGSEMTEPAAVANRVIELQDLDYRQSKKMHLSVVRLLLQDPLKTTSAVDRARCSTCGPSPEALLE